MQWCVINVEIFTAKVNNNIVVAFVVGLKSNKSTLKEMIYK